MSVPTMLAAADKLDELLPRLRELSGKKGRVNDPITITVAKVIVSLRDAAAEESSG